VKDIRAEVESWEGVSTHAHRFGGVEFRLGRRELGHLYGDPPRLADLPFHRRIRNMLVETGRALPHHVLPDSGWVPIRTDEDAAETIELFRLSYERARVAAIRTEDRRPARR
jgi:hypothetical protein